jgi:hypothetical protein
MGFQWVSRVAMLFQIRCFNVDGIDAKHSYPVRKCDQVSKCLITERPDCMRFEPMKLVRRTPLLPVAILMFSAAFTAEEAGCAQERVQQVLGVSWEAISQISDVEDVREVLQVATAVHCAAKLGDMYDKALRECDAVSNFSDNVYCQVEAKQQFDKIRLLCLQLVDGNPGGDGGGGGGGGGDPQPPPYDPPPPPSPEPCGGSCQSPFYCDTHTNNCICVSSCDTLCGQPDGCGNQCPYEPSQGQCGTGSGS